MDDGSSFPAAAAAAAMETEEHLNWKKNAPVLYDLVISHPLEWFPSESSAAARSHQHVPSTHADDSPNHLI
jgi:histone-binding protein RBBP4